jgi:hypothetical protein
MWAVDSRGWAIVSVHRGVVRHREPIAGVHVAQQRPRQRRQGPDRAEATAGWTERVDGSEGATAWFKSLE